MVTEPTLSKQQEVVLARALHEGGACDPAAAYAALVDLAGIPAESDEERAESEAESMLLSTGNVLQSLVELGLMVKSGPGKYDLTKEGSRIAENFG